MGGGRKEGKRGWARSAAPAQVRPRAAAPELHHTQPQPHPPIRPSRHPSPTRQVSAILNLGRSAFIIAALGAGIVLMQRDASRLVLRPVERMLRRVRAVSENPLATKKAKLDKGVPEKERLMETRILEVAITKICSLMAVGFGDAGAEARRRFSGDDRGVRGGLNGREIKVAAGFISPPPPHLSSPSILR